MQTRVTTDSAESGSVGMMGLTEHFKKIKTKQRQENIHFLLSEFLRTFRID